MTFRAPLCTLSKEREIRKKYAEEFVELLRPHDQELTLENLVEIRKQTALDEAAEPEPRHKERVMRVSKSTEGLRLIEAGVKVFVNINSKEQQAATRQGTVEMLASYEEIMKDSTRYLSCQTSVLDFLNSHSGTRSWPYLLLDIR